LSAAEVVNGTATYTNEVRMLSRQVDIAASNSIAMIDIVHR